MSDKSTNLVSPKSGKVLYESDRGLITECGSECFELKNGIACLLDPTTLDVASQHEMSVFDELNLDNISFFRECLFQDVLKKIKQVHPTLEKRQEELAFVELGGGEGHWARHFKVAFPEANGYVCDLSFKTLERAPEILNRVCANVTDPIFQKKSIHLAAFWVSLHHLETKHVAKALEEVRKALADDGMVIMFEPNAHFLPRQLMYESKLSNDVYPDEQEQAINFTELSSIAESVGLMKAGTYFLNPHYNPNFIKKLKRWQLYLPVVELLHQLDRWIYEPILGSLFSKKQLKWKKYLTLYGLSLYKKRNSELMAKSCLVCGDTNFVPLGVVDKYSLLECQQCDLQFLDPAPDEASLNEIYKDYYKAWDLKHSEKEVSLMKQETFSNYFKLITPYITSGNLLDVGCATGELMQIAQSNGFDVYGVEVSPYGVNLCREQFGEDKVIEGNLKFGDFPENFFDIITLSDVLEHIVEPLPFLDALYGILKPGGILMIVTPDTSSVVKKLMGKRWLHYKAEHIYYYNQKNLVQLLSSQYTMLLNQKAYKKLNVNYITSVICTYSKHQLWQKLVALGNSILSPVRHSNFPVYIGEMFILFRKK